MFYNRNGIRNYERQRSMRQHQDIAKALLQYRYLAREIKQLEAQIENHRITIDKENDAGRRLLMRLNKRKERLIKQRNDIERFTGSIPETYLQNAIKWHYLDGLNWTRVAGKLGRLDAADAIRMTVTRYLKSVNRRQPPFQGQW